MAKRRNQSNSENTVLKIAFILSVMTSIGLLIALSVVYGNIQTQEDRANKNEEDKIKAEITAANFRYTALTVLPMIGVAIVSIIVGEGGNGWLGALVLGSQLRQLAPLHRDSHLPAESLL